MTMKLQIVTKGYWTFWIVVSILGIGGFAASLLSGEKGGLIVGVTCLLHGLAFTIVYWSIKIQSESPVIIQNET
ncbi:MAG TPA: hypothetical protein VFA77_07430 [Candidatus Eisenbacteria bacterium]|nr:hypothetical protein [Candidatus Eisenbacteria bacterium]